MPLLVVTTPRTIFASSGAAWIGSWPHDGEFTVEGDRKTASWQGVSVSVVSIVFRESQSASEGEATLVTLQVKELTKKLLALKSESAPGPHSVVVELKFPVWFVVPVDC